MPLLFCLRGSCLRHVMPCIFIQPRERSERGCTKSYRGLEGHFWPQNDRKWSFLIARRSSLEILVLSPRSKFGGPKRTSRTGQEDGWEKKQKKSFLRGEFCRTKTPIFRLFRKFAKLAILIGKYLRDNGTYRKNGVYHDEANGKCKKTVISDFWFSNFCHRDFSI